jgi:predicted MFS family arabinose efflux permease
VLLAITEGPSWGWLSARVLGFGIGGLILLVVWWLYERRTKHPIVSVKHLVNPSTRLPYAITFLAAIGIYSALTAVTRLAQTPRATGAGYGWPVAETAWYAVPQVIGSVGAFFVIRALVARGRHVQALMVGAGLLVLSFIFYGFFVTSPGSTLTALLFDAAGLAMVLALTQIIVLRAVTPTESGMVLGLSIIMYAAGNSMGSALAGSFFGAFTAAPGVPSIHAYQLMFLVAGLSAFCCLLLCMPLLRHSRAATDDPSATTLQNA